MDRFDGDAAAALRRARGLAAAHAAAPGSDARPRCRARRVARDAVWLVTDDDHHGLYRVDIDTGAVTDLGSAPPPSGEAEGIDAADLSSGDLHATVVDADRAAVTLDHFRTSGDGRRSRRERPSKTDTSWPPALVYFAILLAFVGAGRRGHGLLAGPHHDATEALSVGTTATLRDARGGGRHHLGLGAARRATARSGRAAGGPVASVGSATAVRSASRSPRSTARRTSASARRSSSGRTARCRPA